MFKPSREGNCFCTVVKYFCSRFLLLSIYQNTSESIRPCFRKKLPHESTALMSFFVCFQQIRVAESSFSFHAQRLYLTCKSIPESMWSKVWLCYVNMCNVVRLKSASNCDAELPDSFGKMKNIWKYANKMIDGLHIRNHKRTSCKIDLGPHRFDEIYPELKETRNSMAAEQVFIWVGRFKKNSCCYAKRKTSFLVTSYDNKKKWIYCQVFTCQKTSSGS